MKRLSYRKNNNIVNKPRSKIYGGKPPATPVVADNGGCREIANLAGHRDLVSSVAFHPTAPLLATGSWDHTAKLWRFSPDGTNPTCVATMSDHVFFVTSVAFHPTDLNRYWVGAAGGGP